MAIRRLAAANGSDGISGSRPSAEIGTEILLARNNELRHETNLFSSTALEVRNDTASFSGNFAL